MTRWHIIQGDLRAGALDTLEPESFHAVLCDPPYGLSPDGRARTWDDVTTGRGFMGKVWDAAVPGPTFWRSVLRVLRPGAHVLAFGGTRTYHRTAGALEDAGFELRDMLAWLYGSGFPKSLDVSKAIDAAAGAEREVVGSYAVTREFRGRELVGDASHATTVAITAPATPDAARWSGYGTALKPAQEPIALARKPLAGTVAANVQKHGCGALAIDAGRVGTTGGTKGSNCPKTGMFRIGGNAKVSAIDAGRWPANVLLDEAAAAMLDEQSGELRNGGQNATSNRRSASVAHGEYAPAEPTRFAGDTGGASRFFYTAKASRREREAGCEGLDGKLAQQYGSIQDGRNASGEDYARSPTRNHHPTVKPMSLTTYLARLLLPPPGPTPRRILVPFGGSGSEMIGCLLAGWDEVVGVEMEAEYVAIARARIQHWCPDELTLQVAE